MKLIPIKPKLDLIMTKRQGNRARPGRNLMSLLLAAGCIVGTTATGLAEVAGLALDLLGAFFMRARLSHSRAQYCFVYQLAILSRRCCCGW